ncbi:C-terminal autoproteolytic domain of nucleoporin nup98 [Ascoidea rubescens DSM 1968]|uniref:C-terminal autoproteolytic domain of nucleoporin nup98 n=1 Tax=Ascoidea rubescens DSM 1968 TaxID=1344418 RepID=A0A1D2VJE4_9ASCO|nr:C-terminal autoproteolytic domain of nucleoporin nup98 [Ascoidea rubescens DSM 1968]ODV61724.1 C-terminal autoproteolytic domain of nucleoporin nup98 [Ascoidea rubescens DSM 1968]
MKLLSVESFTTGREGYGKIEFKVPVDLSVFLSYSEITRNRIVFNKQACNVYSNEDEKPPVGEGFNILPRATLENCFPVLNKEIITDRTHPIVKPHITKLHSMSNSKFESYDADSGVWSFSIEHV